MLDEPSRHNFVSVKHTVTNGAQDPPAYARPDRVLHVAVRAAFVRRHLRLQAHDDQDASQAYFCPRYRPKRHSLRRRIHMGQRFTREACPGPSLLVYILRVLSRSVPEPRHECDVRRTVRAVWRCSRMRFLMRARVSARAGAGRFVN